MKDNLYIYKHLYIIIYIFIIIMKKWIYFTMWDVKF